MTETKDLVRAALAIDPTDRPEQERFVAEQLGEADARAVWATAEAIHAAHAELHDQRRSGVGRAAWLGGVLREAGAVADIVVPHLVQLGLPAAGSPEAIAHSTLEAARAAEAAGLEALAAGPRNLPQPSQAGTEAPSASAGAYFERSLGDPADVGTVATLAAVAMAPAREQLGPDVPVGAVVAAVDLGCSTAKAAYHAATGKTQPLDAMEWLEDRAAAAVAGAVRAGAPKAGEVAGAWIGGVLGAFVNAAPIGQQLGGQLGRLAGHACANKLAEGAHTLVRAGIRASKQAVSYVSERLRALGGAVAGLFT